MVDLRCAMIRHECFWVGWVGGICVYVPAYTTMMDVRCAVTPMECRAGRAVLAVMLCKPCRAGRAVQALP